MGEENEWEQIVNATEEESSERVIQLNCCTIICHKLIYIHQEFDKTEEKIN